jgi:hypothetical protein
MDNQNRGVVFSLELTVSIVLASADKSEESEDE